MRKNISNFKTVIWVIAVAMISACRMEPSMNVSDGGSTVNAQVRYASDTKAALLSSLPDTFTLFASSYSGSVPSGIDYIYGETMTKDDDKWVSANKFAKVASDKTVLYWGIYPSDAPGLTLPEPTASGMPKITYSTPASAIDGRDIIIGANSYSGSQEKISLTMDHTLAAVDFKFSAGGAFNGTVKSISVRNVKTKGDYTLGSGWDNLSTDGDIAQILNKTVTEDMGGESITSASDAITIIPQTADSTATLEMVVNDGTGDISFECSLVGWRFVAGKEYTVFLDFSNKIIIEGVDVTDWVSAAMGHSTATGIPSATFDVSFQTSVAPSVSLPDATLDTGTVVAIDWGDGNIEIKTRSAGGRETFSHTYASMYTGKVKIDVKKGLMDFGKEVQEVMDMFEINDNSKILMELMEGFVFKVSSAGKRVTFSPGNLWWDGSAFHFEEHQYDYPASWNENHVGHFRWGTTVEDAVASDSYFLPENKFFATSGVTVAGYDQEWTILSKDEWDYILTNAVAENSWGENNISIAGRNCLVLKPDGFSGTVADSYTAEAWAVAEEQYGLVALPFAGERSGTEIFNCGSRGHHWTSTMYDGGHSYLFVFMADLRRTNYSDFYHGLSVRLVPIQ